MSPSHAVGPLWVETAVLLLLEIVVSLQSLVVLGKPARESEADPTWRAGVPEREAEAVERGSPRKREDAARDPGVHFSELLGLPVAGGSQMPWAWESAGDREVPRQAGE